MKRLTLLVLVLFVLTMGGCSKLGLVPSNTQPNKESVAWPKGLSKDVTIQGLEGLESDDLAKAITMVHSGESPFKKVFASATEDDESGCLVVRGEVAYFYLDPSLSLADKRAGILLLLQRMKDHNTEFIEDEEVAYLPLIGKTKNTEGSEDPISSNQLMAQAFDLAALSVNRMFQLGEKVNETAGIAIETAGKMSEGSDEVAQTAIEKGAETTQGISEDQTHSANVQATASVANDFIGGVFIVILLVLALVAAGKITIKKLQGN